MNGEIFRGRRSRLILLLFISGFVLRANGVPFSALLILISSALLLIIVLKSIITAIQQRNGWKIVFRLMLAGILIFVTVRHMSWIEKSVADFLILAAWAGTTILIVRSKQSLPALWMVCGILLVLSVALNPRQHYNFFRSDTYEAYIRARFTERESLKADLYIDRFKPGDTTGYASLVISAEEAVKKEAYPEAIQLYNEAIDLFPDDAAAYHKRGYLKMTRLELDNDVAYAAVKDFNRAIRLKPDFAMAYFHRGVALSYLDKKVRCCLDMHRAKNLDSTLDVREYLERSCYVLSDTASPEYVHP